MTALIIDIQPKGYERVDYSRFQSLTNRIKDILSRMKEKMLPETKAITFGYIGAWTGGTIAFAVIGLGVAAISWLPIPVFFANMIDWFALCTLLYIVAKSFVISYDYARPEAR